MPPHPYRPIPIPSPQSSIPLTSPTATHSLTTVHLALLNKSHASLRRRLGKSAVIIDHSMMDIKDDGGEMEGNVENAEGWPRRDENGEGAGSRRDKAFDDVTDLKNEDFIFVY